MVTSVVIDANEGRIDSSILSLTCFFFLPVSKGAGADEFAELLCETSNAFLFLWGSQPPATTAWTTEPDPQFGSWGWGSPGTLTARFPGKSGAWWGNKLSLQKPSIGFSWKVKLEWSNTTVGFISLKWWLRNSMLGSVSMKGNDEALRHCKYSDAKSAIDACGKSMAPFDREPKTSVGDFEGERLVYIYNVIWKQILESKIFHLFFFFLVVIYFFTTSSDVSA